MFDTTDWELTSLMGMEVSAGIPGAKLGPLSAGIGLIPMDFKNVKTGATRKLAVVGMGASVSKGGEAGPGSRAKKLPGSLQFPISPSFPTLGTRVKTLTMADDPFDIDQVRGLFGAVVSVGGNLGLTGSTGAIVFTIMPPVGVGLATISLALGIAACGFVTTGTAVGGLGATAEQFLFWVSSSVQP